MENAPPLLIITRNRLFAETISRHLALPCLQSATCSEDASALLFLPETLTEVMQMEAQAAGSALPGLMLLPEEAQRSQPTACRSLQRPVSLAQLQKEVHLLLQQPRKIHWPDIGYFDPLGLRLSNLFGQSLTLTEKESELLTYLNNQQKSVTRETLMERIWCYHPDAETHTLETHLYRLRQKLQEIFGENLQIVNDKNGYLLTQGQGN